MKLILRSLIVYFTSFIVLTCAHSNQITTNDDESAQEKKYLIWTGVGIGCVITGLSYWSLYGIPNLSSFFQWLLDDKDISQEVIDMHWHIIEKYNY